MFEKLLTSDLVKSWFFATVRHLVALAVPALIATGVMDQSQSNDLLGAVMFLAALGWSWWQKHNQQTAIAVAKGVK